MDSEIQRSVRKLFEKFLLLQLAILTGTVLLSIFFTAHYKHRLATQLSSASRDALLSGDSRRAMIDLTAAVTRDFSGLIWVPSGGEDGFSLPSGSARTGNLLLSVTRVRIYFDTEGRFSSGEMIFCYPRWPQILWGTLAWLSIFLFSIPVALRERSRLIADYDLMLKLRIKESYGTLAAQVAHDIRSPLAALRSGISGLDAAAEHKELLAGAASRINDIAEDLLRRYKKPGEVPAAEAPAACPVNSLVRQVIEEKRLQFKGNTGVRLELAEGPGGIFVMAEAKELQRLVSNLLNNSLEAMANGGTAKVLIRANATVAEISVSDSGKGIPPEVLAKLGTKGGTHGKSGGTGLGLYHARSKVESWNGKMKIVSEQGKGTDVIITLPLVAAPSPDSGPVVLLDDDPLVHMNWKMAAKAAGAELKAYQTRSELWAAIGELPKNARIYIDSELGNGEHGEEIAIELREKGFSHIAMATGHEAGKFARLDWLKVTGKEPPWKTKRD